MTALNRTEALVSLLGSCLAYLKESLPVPTVNERMAIRAVGKLASASSAVLCKSPGPRWHRCSCCWRRRRCCCGWSCCVRWSCERRCVSRSCERCGVSRKIKVLDILINVDPGLQLLLEDPVATAELAQEGVDIGGLGLLWTLGYPEV